MLKMIKSRFQPYQMRNVVTFNKQIEKENKYTGMIETYNQAWFTKHCAKVKTTLSQKFSVVGTQFENALVLAIKHDKRLELENYNYLTCTFKGIDYRIIDISVDDENYLSYDLITLSKKEGHSSGT